MKKKRGRPRTTIDIDQVRTLLSEGLSRRRIARRLRVGEGTLRRATEKLGLPKPARGRPWKISDHRKLDSVTVPEMESPLQAFESLLIFDARCLDQQDRQALMSFIPQLLHIHKAWKAEYMECGCISCHKKDEGYGAGGFCNACYSRIYQRVKKRFRKAVEGHDLPAELAAFKDALQLKYNAAQRLFNGDE